jgi:radical SAM superfamily enzyme YgiQ (UPF0313 family)
VTDGNIHNRIALISVNQYRVPYPVYPLGLSYIATHIRNSRPDWDVEIIDLNIDDFDACVDKIQRMKPSYVGVSLRNIDDVNFFNRENFIHDCRGLIARIREAVDATVILGGAGFSLYPVMLYEFLKTDYAIVGEGEETFLSLIEHLDGGKDVSAIPGLVYSRDGVIKANPRCVPRPRNSFTLSYEKDLVGYYWRYGGMLNIQTKRGCPYSCVYCTYPVIEGSDVRTNSIERVIASLHELYHTHGVDYVFFTDSVFNIDDDYNREFALALVESKIPMRWGAYFSPSNIDEDMLVLMKKSGLTHIEFGTESLSDTTLDAYRKGFTVADVLRVSALCNKHEMNFAHFMILGGYGETEATLDETFENCKRIDNTVFFPFIGMRIYPGTDLRRIAVDEGLVRTDDPLIDPVYYVAKGIDVDSIKERAKATGRKWYFPDEDFSPVLEKMRARDRKGLLWEYLIRY